MLQAQHILVDLVLVTQLLVYNVHLIIMDHVGVNVHVMQKIVTHNVNAMRLFVHNAYLKKLAHVMTCLATNVRVTRKVAVDIVPVML